MVFEDLQHAGESVMSKVWMITGASRGLGSEIAKTALASGDTVIATARRKEDIRLDGGTDKLLSLSVDVTNEQQAIEATKDGVRQFGRIDVLVNNAGYGVLGAIEEASASEVEAIYRTNVFGLLNVTSAVLPTMKKQRSGHILNISSLGGYQSYPGWGIYCSTKFAVEGITEALQQELLPLGINATVVEPGFFRTDFMDSSSLHRTQVLSQDYEATVGKTRGFADENSGQQPGDPRKLAKVILEIVNAAVPPLRMPIGPDAVQRIIEKNRSVSLELEKWRSLAESTNYEQ
jgi:NAD(P)-dependent dehydrogenase (short-subunit alcohol dehydrogenase family)